MEYWLGSFVIFRGSGPVLLWNPIFFVIFQGGGGTPVPPLNPRMVLLNTKNICK